MVTDINCHEKIRMDTIQEWQTQKILRYRIQERTTDPTKRRTRRQIKRPRTRHPDQIRPAMEIGKKATVASTSKKFFSAKKK